MGKNGMVAYGSLARPQAKALAAVLHRGPLTSRELNYLRNRCFAALANWVSDIKRDPHTLEELQDLLSSVDPYGRYPSFTRLAQEIDLSMGDVFPEHDPKDIR